MELKTFLYSPEPNSLFKKSCISVMSLLVNPSVITKFISYKRCEIVPETELVTIVKKFAFSTLQNNVTLPKTVKTRLTYLIHPMVKEIFSFIELIYILDENTAKGLLWEFVWTDRGVLDKQKSVEALIKLNNLKTEFCFMLACFFGLENILLQFRGLETFLLQFRGLETFLLQSRDLDKIFIQFGGNQSFSVHYSSCIQRYVEYVACKELNSDIRPAEPSPMDVHGVYSIINDACVVKFIISKKNAQEKKSFARCVLRILFEFKYKMNIECIRYLLSCVLPHEAVDIVRKNAFHYLLALLDWTCLDLFIPSIKNLWSHLTNTEYLHLTEEITKRFQEFDFSPDYQILFLEFWDESPGCFKEYVYRKCISGSFLSRILIMEYVDDIFEKIMEDASPDMRRRMIFHFEGMNVCDALVRKGNLGLLEKFVRCCIPNKIVLSEFLNQYVEYKPYYFKEEMTLRKQKFREIATQWFQ